MSCQQRSLATESSIWGTATERTTQWVLVEYCGQWHPKMKIAELSLAADCATALESVSKRDGWKIVWIRRPGASNTHIYWWDLNASTCRVASKNTDWSGGFEAAQWSSTQDAGLSAPQVLVCTHGSRDRCCGVLGGFIFAQLKRHLPETVWQVSHLGGHRFAPTAVCLPLGLMLGRVDANDCMDIARAVLTHSRQPLRLDIIRGDVRLHKYQQARQLWLQQQHGTVQTEEGEEVFHWLSLDGVVHQTTQTKKPLGELAVSCANEKTKPVYQWVFHTKAS